MTAYRHPHDLIREWTERQEAVRRAYHGEQEAATDRVHRDRATRHAAAQKRYRERKKK